MKKNIKTRMIILLFTLAVFSSMLSIGVSAQQYHIDEDFFEKREFIAKIAEMIAPDSSYAARLGVCAVIVNRMTDSRFPSDVYSVVYHSQQFREAQGRELDSVSASELSEIAARDALLGFDITGGAVYFKRGYPSERQGACFYHDGFLFYR